MTNQNNAAQAANENPLSDEYVNAIIQRHGYHSPESVIAQLHQWIGLHGGEDTVTLLMYEAHKVLSQLRAPVTDERAVLADLLDYVDSNTCIHESTHRGGAIWTICDGCGMKWADDEGGFVPHQDAPAVAAARATLASAPAAKNADELSDYERGFAAGWDQCVASAPVAGEPFMYGIMGPDGNAHFEEFCVSGDRDELQAEVVDHLNRDNPEDGSYSVVALFRDAAPQARAENVRNAALEEAYEAVACLYAAYYQHSKRSESDDTLQALKQAGDDIRALKQPQAGKPAARCTCPSGDGSLRHPCPAHPQTNEGRA